MTAPKSTLAALTGGVACGKSTVAAILHGAGVGICDADRLAREALAPGTPGAAEVKRRFGPGVVGPDGEIDRDALRRQVLADPAARKELETIVHPRVRAAWQAWADGCRRDGRRGAVVIPLLFEVGADREDWTAIVCVAAPETAQRERLARRGWTETEIDAVLAAQWPLETKMKRSDHVIWNDGTLEDLNQTVLALAGRIWKETP